MTARGRMPRQTDIARIAGVSQATVSVVLAGNRAVRMAESTRRRVLEVAEELGYVPHPAATRLASSRANLLGLYTFRTTFPTNEADSYHPILSGVEEEAAALGQDLILFTGTSGPQAVQEAAIRRTRMADGCLFFGRHVPEGPVSRLVGTGSGIPGATAISSRSRARASSSAYSGLPPDVACTRNRTGRASRTSSRAASSSNSALTVTGPTAIDSTWSPGSPSKGAHREPSPRAVAISRTRLPGPSRRSANRSAPVVAASR